MLEFFHLMCYVYCFISHYLIKLLFADNLIIDLEQTRKFLLFYQAIVISRVKLFKTHLSFTLRI